MRKDILAICITAVLAVVFVLCTNFQTVEEYQKAESSAAQTSAEENSETVTLTIRCDAVLQQENALDPALKNGGYLPKDGIILAETAYPLQENETVFSLLSRVARNQNIQLEYQGAEQNVLGTVYVQGISYLYEFSCGENSGWVYRVNGTVPNVGCSAYSLKSGDTVEWLYTCRLGQDIEEVYGKSVS